MDLIIKTKDKSIYRNSSILSGQNLIKLDTFFLMKSLNYNREFPEYQLTIYGESGDRISFLSDFISPTSPFQKQIPIADNSGTIRDYLSNIKTILAIKVAHFQNTTKSISNNDFWSYRTIVFNSLSDNLKPQSALANVVYWLKNALGAGLALSIIGSLLLAYMQQKPVNS